MRAWQARLGADTMEQSNLLLVFGSLFGCSDGDQHTGGLRYACRQYPHAVTGPSHANLIPRLALTT